MSIHNKAKRVERLEAKDGPKQMLDAIILQGVRPGSDGPVVEASGSAYVLKGKLAGNQLVKKPGELWHEFEARVKASNSE